MFAIACAPGGPLPQAAEHADGGAPEASAGEPGDGSRSPASPAGRAGAAQAATEANAPAATGPLRGVRVHGDGCPEGTWVADVSPGGDALTVRFSAYEATLDPGQHEVRRSCNASIVLDGSEPLSFAVTSFHYAGFVFLDSAGMVAGQKAQYSLASSAGGDAHRASSARRSEFTGPTEREYLLSDEVAPGGPLWTECDRRAALDVQSEIWITNTPECSGSGYMNTSAVDASREIVLELRAKPCATR